MTQTLTRAGATRTALAARAAVVVLAGTGVLLAMTGLPDRTVRARGAGVPPGMPGSETAVPGTDLTPVAFAPVDAEGVAARLALLDNAPRIVRPQTPDPAEPTPDAPVAADEQAVDALADRVRFLGMIQSGDRVSALVRVDGRQRIVSQGATVPPPEGAPDLTPVTVRAITADRLVVEDASGRASLELTARRGPSVTLVGGGVVSPRNAAEPQDPGGIRPDEGVTPAEQARRARMFQQQNDASNTARRPRSGGLRPGQPTQRDDN